ncbi:peptidase M48 Ste24p [Leadbetterella byssophila DSM 17132]|uniref:Peptidase M48 Ste24p n=1 Tax=Leadbetterella byssophila (strain DSM 17132 / JCM 16389 / KACC 11308 / NBRC 106382 / 4M15) TaxID=649349 RepID=E4RU77_LEAB4|nr:M48 family metallopeptidase [Leadbetterella byssophila]ADQ16911.1 peptidase M48 Ste24p [Leadbetterella byssophila DSM 17132]
MNKTARFLISAGFLTLFVWSCQRVPLTNRKQFVGLVSSGEMMALSYTEYKGFMDTSKVLPSSDPNAQMVSRVGEKIRKAAEDYLIANNLSKLLDGYQWEFKTVKSNEVNAWCMPGGKVCFYTGILPICKSEAGVAVVMGHEVAHAIAEHGRERMSNALIANGITQAGALATGIATGNQDLMNLAGQVLGIGTQVGGTLPNSRKQESEADKIGLIFMAMAGYNPQEAVDFWKRMAEAGKNSQKPPQMLSTHPSDETRIADLQKNMDVAMKYYNTYKK